ncbi:restriction endonuclease subunit S [Klebsiella pneumoniae]|uniref:restriction endonuclease subunit S n=1 Tax=Klebsiella pneumoniae TaxID=573 RepID=UPI000DE5E80C|nr:restriction endonuclease subunit S [Klebsiella pneumoniae]MBX4658082.1 restriction endonuclease [Klebsiella pneumoniae]MDT3769425.1 restriction endonuclease subunit S [Klebsiella pneumoniae]MEC4474522.1 restriction endonuclease subunit S [Klebsiella pneumoniae]UPZ02136.1 restriction endonuclease subunit S [Klebsiella pneumoniae]SSL85744.1 Restriction modification system DNA specificity domain protein [Klebsiella pneumoniae]
MSERSYLEKLLDGVEVEWKFLGDASFFEIANNGRKPVKSSLRVAGKTPYYGANNIQDYVDGYTHDGEYVLIAEDGSASLECYSIQYTTGKFWANNHVHVVRGKSGVSSRFLYHYLQIVNFIPFLTGGVRAKLTKGQLVEIPVPIPCPDNPGKSLAIQSEIVRILDKFTAITAELTAELSMRKKQYNYYRDQLLSFDDGGAEWKTLGELAENLDSKRKPITSGLREAGSIPYYGASGIVDYVKDYIYDGDFLLVSEDGANLLARNTPIAFSISGKTWVNNHAHVLKFDTYAERRYVEYYLNSIDLTTYISGAAQPKLNKKNLESIRIPNPSPEEKERIVSILDKFDALTNSITEGLPREIELRQKQYEYYRDMLLSFPKQEVAEA